MTKIRIVKQEIQAKGAPVKSLSKHLTIPVWAVMDIPKSNATALIGCIKDFMEVSTYKRYNGVVYLYSGFTKIVELTLIPTMDIGDVLWQVGQAYKKIYSTPDKYGVYRDVNELWFERIAQFRNGVVQLFIGS